MQTLESIIIKIVFENYINKFFGVEWKSLSHKNFSLQFEGFSTLRSDTYMRYLKQYGLDEYFEIKKHYKLYTLLYKKKPDETLIGFLRLNNLIKY